MTSILALLTRFWKREDAFLRVTGTATPTQSVAINPLKAQAALVAPYYVALEANVTDFGVTAGGTGEWDPQYHDIEYIWSVEKVGDASYATSTYTAPVNVPAANRVKGTKYGKRIVHVIGRDDVSAGSSSTFRFTVTAVNLATGVSATSSVYERTIEHPDDYFSAAETYVVRRSGSSETGYPTTSNSLYTSFGAANSAANSSGNSKVRVVIQKGVWSGLFAADGWTPATTGDVYLYDTWGADSEKPELGNRWKPLQGNAAEALISGINPQSGGDNLWLDSTDGTMSVAVFDSMDTSGLGQALGRFVSTPNDNLWVAYSNCAAEGFTQEGSMLASKTMALIGCRIVCLPTQSSDNKGGGGFGIRSDRGTELMYISQSEGFTRQGWFNNVPGIQTTQAMLRLFGTGTSQRAGQYIHVERCTLEGACSIGNDDTNIMNVLIERNINLRVHDTGSWYIATAATMRNNLLIVPPSRDAQNGIFPQEARLVTFATPGTIVQDPRDSLAKVYNNTIIHLSNVAATAANIVNEGSYTVIEANNVFHAPNMASPVSAGSFTLTEAFTPRYDGYDERRGSPGDPQYRVQVNTSSLSGTFTIGETVTGGTSGVSKTLRVIEAPGTWFVSREGYRFDASEINTRIDQAAGFERFTAGETLTGGTSGATISVNASGYLGQPHDSGWDLIGLIPRTITPTHYIDYDAETAAFTEGNTLTNGTATATICQVWDDGTTGRLWLRDIAGGTFSDNDSLTESDGSGAATANGGQQSAGTGAIWIPASAITLEAGAWATKPNTANGRDFFGLAGPNSQGIAKVV